MGTCQVKLHPQKALITKLVSQLLKVSARNSETALHHAKNNKEYSVNNKDDDRNSSAVTNDDPTNRFPSIKLMERFKVLRTSNKLKRNSHQIIMTTFKNRHQKSVVKLEILH